MQNLAVHVPEIMESKNVEKGEAYQEIFLEIGKGNIKTIIQDNETQILVILLDLMGMGCMKEDELSDENYSLRIPGRHQTSFWREFIKQIS